MKYTKDIYYCDLCNKEIDRYYYTTIQYDYRCNNHICKECYPKFKKTLSFIGYAIHEFDSYKYQEIKELSIYKRHVDDYLYYNK